MTLEDQIIEKIKIGKSGECWEWQGLMHKKWNKPFFKCGKKRIWVHRFVYEMEFDAIPEKGNLWRLCFNQKCCNPKHMKVIMPYETCPESPGMKKWKQERSPESIHMQAIKEESLLFTK